jgi:H+/Cl- antiporter ClcA
MFCNKYNSHNKYINYIIIGFITSIIIILLGSILTLFKMTNHQNTDDGMHYIILIIICSILSTVHKNIVKPNKLENVRTMY